MKKIVSIFIFSLAVFYKSNAQAPVLICSLTIAATNDIEPEAKYVLLRSEVKSSYKELMKSRAKTIDEAIDHVILTVPGGVFMKNVKIFSIWGNYGASGDVWGIPQENYSPDLNQKNNVIMKSKGKKKKRDKVLSE